MKGNVIHENHAEHTENFPFIFHYDVLNKAGKAPKKEIHVGNRQYYYGNCPVNWHKNIELLCFCEGNAHLFSGNENYDVTGGSVYIINANHLHSVSTEDYTAYFCLIIDHDFCLQNDIPIDSICFRNDDPASPELYRLFLDIAEAFELNDTFRGLRIKARALRLLTFLCEHSSSPLDAVPDTDRNVASIKTALQYIDQNLTRRLSLSEIAAAAGMSKFYFANEFRHTVGCTCVEYVNTMRCHHAKTLLATGKYTVGEVCYLCGFENLSYFSKTFFRYTGEMPSAYKKQKGKRPPSAPQEKKEGSYYLSSKNYTPDPKDKKE